MKLTYKEGAGFQAVLYGWALMAAIIATFIAALPNIIDRELHRQEVARIVDCQHGYYPDSVCNASGITYRHISRDAEPKLYQALGGEK